MLSFSCATLALQHGGVTPFRAARASVSMASPDEYTVAVLGDLHVSGTEMRNALP